jgi:anhydro-N-acetylmuramic acid kinase
MAFDKNGKLASDGIVNDAMLKSLGKAYGKLGKSRPSLSRELFEKHFLKVLDKKIPLEDRLCTFTESIAIEIAKGFPSEKKISVLCTGGGSFNSYLMYRLIEHCGNNVVLILPDEETVNFKEALIFALLGILRVRGEVNCLKSVTGARQDNCGGVQVG